MICKFLGTSGAQGFPPIYGRNDFYTSLREEEPDEVRTRTGFRIGREHQIDLSPDIAYQLRRYGSDMYDIRHLLITHTHADHFAPQELFDALSMCSEEPASTNTAPINLYLSTAAHEWLIDRYLPVHHGFLNKKRLKDLEQFLNIHCINYFESFRAGDLEVDAVKGNHHALGVNESALNYLVHSPSRSILLAWDTGFYQDDTWEYLQGKRADTVVMEATFGPWKDRGHMNDTHMNFDTFHNQLEKMSKIGFIDSNTRIYATHISSALHMSHQHLQAQLDTYGFGTLLAKDELEFQF
ncbi:MBL fold metallo-hydrolase [Porticoccus sp. W117]|uniref:MBL fold metallo-hydrolase n=1 Tax=Porticoccus sp. W117 TaxID=3054777 RepID=UPI002595A785|nr:MBL fold metallo-hydrolase [Porticoccus sp. W117]MDM3870093.1 MBL fold metallo-hydrolase [Porticoccus sp. W117]